MMYKEKITIHFDIVIPEDDFKRKISVIILQA